MASASPPESTRRKSKPESKPEKASKPAPAPKADSGCADLVAAYLDDTTLINLSKIAKYLVTHRSECAKARELTGDTPAGFEVRRIIAYVEAKEE